MNNVPNEQNLVRLLDYAYAQAFHEGNLRVQLEIRKIQESLRDGSFFLIMNDAAAEKYRIANEELKTAEILATEIRDYLRDARYEHWYDATSLLSKAADALEHVIVGRVK